MTGKAIRVDTCEAIVVGAGIVGAAIAAQLAAEGLDVAVLDARRTASGATGRTAGLALTGLPELYSQTVERYGHETAKRLWQLTGDNQRRILSTADRLGLTVERTGSLVMAASAQEVDPLHAAYEQLVADGFNVRFENDDPLGRGFEAALRYPDDLTFDPVALTKALFASHRIPIHADTEVYRLQQDGDQVLVQARGRTVRAGTVVLAVNAYAALIDDYFDDKVAPARGYLFVTQALEEKLAETPGRVGDILFRQTVDGRLLLSIWPERYETPASGPDERSAEIDLMQFAGQYFPQTAQQFSQRWSSVAGITPDGLPLLGALPHLPQVFFAVGFADAGLSLALTAADLLAGLIVRGAEPELLSARRLE